MIPLLIKILHSPLVATTFIPRIATLPIFPIGKKLAALKVAAPKLILELLPLSGDFSSRIFNFRNQ